MRRPWLALCTALAVGAVGIPTSAAATSVSADGTPTALLRGTLVLVADAHRDGPGEHDDDRDHDHDADALEASLVVGDLAVPLPAGAVEGITPGSTLTLEVPVPAEVVEAVDTGRSVPVESDAVTGDTTATARIPAGALEDAAEVPAAPESDLAAATTVAAAASEEPVSSEVVDAQAPAPVAAAPDAPHTLTVAVATWPGGADGGYTDSVVDRQVSLTSQYWSEQTGGALSFTRTGAVARYTTQVRSCDLNALRNEAAEKTSFSSGAGKHLVVLLPRADYTARGCSYGLGVLGSSPADGGYLYANDSNWTVLAHELGHNVSLLHANALRCSTPKPDAVQKGSTFAGCDPLEYGDSTTIMSGTSGTSTGSLTVVGLAQLGLLDGASSRTVTTSGTTSASLAPLSALTGLRSLVVTDPRNGNEYFLENRQPSGRDTSGWSNSGAGGMTYGVRILKRDGQASVLLDPTPHAQAAWHSSEDTDRTVVAGSTWTSAGGGVQVRTSAAAAGGAVTVKVSVAGDGQPHWTDQAAATTLTAPLVSVPLGTPAKVTVAVATADGTAVPTGALTVSTQGTQRAKATVSKGKASFSLTGLAIGTHTVQLGYVPVVAKSGAVQYSAGSGTATVVVTPVASTVKGSLTSKDTSAADRAVVAVTVSAKGAAPTGTVTVSEGGTVLGSGVLDRGKASVVLDAVPAGTHRLTLGYGGDVTTMASSAAGPDLVVTAKPTTTVRATATKVTAGVASTLTITTTAPGKRDTAAVVTVSEDGTALRTATPVKGRAVVTLPVLAAGTHTLTISQADSAVVDGGEATLTLVVAKAKPVVTTSLAATTVAEGTGTTVAVAVSSAAGTPTGEVQLKEGSTVYATAALDGDGKASLAVSSSIKVGKHSLTVAYSGDSQVLPGAAKAGTIGVTKV